MEKLAHSISEKIALQLDFDEDRKGVIAYGLTAMFQLIVIGVIIAAIGILFRMVYESFVVFLGISILKKSTGGAHSNSIYKCTVISIFIVLILAAISRYLLILQNNIYISISIIGAVFVITILTFYKHVPVDSPNKPIVKAEKIKRLRKQSFIVLTFFIIASFILVCFASYVSRFISVAYCVLLAVVWQTVMLTKYGAQLIKVIDSIIK